MKYTLIGADPWGTGDKIVVSRWGNNNVGQRITQLGGIVLHREQVEHAEQLPHLVRYLDSERLHHESQIKA